MKNIFLLLSLLISATAYVQSQVNRSNPVSGSSTNGRICLSCEGGGGGGGGSTPTCVAGQNILYVDGARTTNNGDGYTWGTAKKYLHAALYIANRCTNITEIRVAKGTYTASTTASEANRENNFFIGDSYSLYGGYPTGGGTRDYIDNPTILDGEIQDLYEAYHVVVIYGITGSVTIDGFQIKNGFAEGTGSVALETGVNMNRNDGAGLYIRDAANVTIRNCAIYTNVANGNGGGIYSRDCNPKIVNTIFSNNTSINGGAMHNTESSTATITNCTFYNNNGVTAGGAVYNSANSVINVANTIIWGNTSAWGSTGTRNVSYSLIQDGTADDNSLNTNPQFLNAGDLNGADNVWFTSDDGLYLKNCSPAINRGDNLATPVTTTDVTGNTRKFNTQIDMGAYESQNIPYPSSGGLSTNGDTTATWVYGGTTALVAPSCEIISLHTPTGFNPFSGSIVAKTFIESGTPAYNAQPFITRHYDIKPENNITPKTAEDTLFYTGTEFTNYNNRPDVIADLPGTSGINKANLRIVRYTGTSATNLPGTYSGNFSLIDPDDADIVWDAVRLHWRISFTVPGAGSYFLTAIPNYRFTGNGNWTDASKWAGNLVPPATLPSWCEVTIAAGANCKLNVPQTIAKDAKLTVATGLISK